MVTPWPVALTWGLLTPSSLVFTNLLTPYLPRILSLGLFYYSALLPLSLGLIVSHGPNNSLTLISIVGYDFYIDRPPSLRCFFGRKSRDTMELALDSDWEALSSRPGIQDFRQGFLISLHFNFLICNTGRIISTSQDYLENEREECRYCKIVIENNSKLLMCVYFRLVYFFSF